MKRLSVVNIIVMSFCAYFMSTNALIDFLPATSTENVTQKNKSCDVVLDFSKMGLNIGNPNFISNSFIKTLALRNNSINSFQENTFNSLPSLETLDLSNNELTAEVLFSFGNLHVLKSLTLDYNPNSLSMATGMGDTYARPQYGWDSFRRDQFEDRGDLSYDYVNDGENSYETSLRRSQEYYYDKCSGDEYYTDNGERKYYSTLEVKYEYPKLTHLSIRKIFINCLASGWANHFPNLSHLDMSENYFHKTSGEVFSRLPTSVTYLKMQNAKLTTLDSSNLKNITHLDLNGNTFGTLGSHYCYENTLCLRNLTNLETLHIADCSIKTIETDAFKDAKKLKYLDMSSNHFEEIPDGTFVFLPALSYLNLSRNNLQFMPDFSNLQNLTSLYMDDIQNKLLLSTALETFSQSPMLEILSLRFNGLTQIPSNFLNKLPKLKELNLRHNSIVTLSCWQWQKNIRRLSLGYNEIKNLEDILLKEAESLEFLDLENNKFTLIKLKSLKYLPDNAILKL